MESLKKHKGITLVALVITIVILLILAGISISAIINQGLFAKANDAKQKTENAEKEESETLENYLAQMNSITFSNIDKINTNPEGAMPKGAVVVEGDAKKGIVIKDSNENEWTWIEVPKSNVFTTAKNADEYDKIKNDLIKYANDYRKGSSSQNYNWTDEWYQGCGIDSSDKYKEMYNKMLKSVYTNGGFWISRYEAGIAGTNSDLTSNEISNVRYEHNNITSESSKAVSQANRIPYNYVYCSEAQYLASEMSTDTDKTSSLLFGIQWDLMCRFLETKQVLKKNEINENSIRWGNYRNNSIKLDRGRYNIKSADENSKWNLFNVNTQNYVEEAKTSENGSYYQLLTTGSSEQTNKMNIYDLAGNVWELTLEKTDNKNSPCSFRGGTYTDDGAEHPVAFRNNFFTNIGSPYIGFRATLY